VRAGRGALLALAVAVIAPLEAAQHGPPPARDAGSGEHVVGRAPLPPVLGGDADELARWTALLEQLHVHDGGAVGATRERRLEPLAGVDPASITPAFLNAARGLDLYDPQDVGALARLLDHWGALTWLPIPFDGDRGRLDAAAVTARANALDAWRRWWTVGLAAGQDAELLARLRERIAADARAGEVWPGLAEAAAAWEHLDAVGGIVLFDPLPPVGPTADVPGSTPEQLAAWTDALDALFLRADRASGAEADRVRAELDAADPVSLTPAYMNAVRGLDLREPRHVAGLFALIEDYLRRIANTPTFFFDGDPSHDDHVRRGQVLDMWLRWWIDERAAGQDPFHLGTYREKVLARLAHLRAPDAPPEDR